MSAILCVQNSDVVRAVLERSATTTTTTTKKKRMHFKTRCLRLYLAPWLINFITTKHAKRYHELSINLHVLGIVLLFQIRIHFEKAIISKRRISFRSTSTHEHTCHLRFAVIGQLVNFASYRPCSKRAFKTPPNCSMWKAFIPVTNGNSTNVNGWF